MSKLLSIRNTATRFLLGRWRLSIEYKEVRRAGGAIRLGNRLILVEQIRKRVTPVRSIFFHAIRMIRRVGVHVITVDGVDSDAASLVFPDLA